MNFTLTLEVILYDTEKKIFNNLPSSSPILLLYSVNYQFLCVSFLFNCMEIQEKGYTYRCKYWKFDSFNCVPTLFLSRSSRFESHNSNKLMQLHFSSSSFSSLLICKKCRNYQSVMEQKSHIS